MIKFFIAIATTTVAVMAIACGGGGDTKTIKTDNGNVQVSTSNKVPDSFPDDFPVYDGADVQGSYSGTQGDVTGTVVTWTTGDGVDKVTKFYTDAFASGKWKSTANGTANNTSYWAGESSDGTQQFYVVVSDADNDKTTIVATAGNLDSSSSSDTPTSEDTPEGEQTGASSSSTSTSGGSTATSANLPPEQDIGADFPKDRVPLPSGARVTSASTISSGGTKSHYVEAYVKDSPENVANYFKTELPKHGWTQALTSESNGEYFATFTAGDQESATITVTQSDVPGYAIVNMAVITAG